MKKLLALLLVLGMASMAQAGFILSVNGVPAEDTLVMAQSESVELDVHIEPGTVFNGGNFDIVVSNNQGTLDASGVTFPAATIRSFFGFTSEWILEDDKGLAGAYAVSGALSGPQNTVITGGDITWNAENNAATEGPWAMGMVPVVNANSYPILMEGLMLHCVEETNFTVSLVAAGEGITMLEHDAAGGVDGQLTIIAAGMVLDTISVPEPMTMSLLGLGGLALLRRRRA